MVTNDTKPSPEEPQTFNKAWNHPKNDVFLQKVARSHLQRISNINKQQVWCMTCKSLKPPNVHQKLWVFIIQHYGGYNQVPCNNFSKNYSLVVHDITFHYLLLMVLHFGYSAKFVDIETAFIYGDLDEEICIECPHGMSNIKTDDCIILN